MAMALPVYAEVDLLPDAPDEVELLEDEQGTASGEDTVPPEQNAAAPEPEQSAEPEQPAPTETPEPTAEPTPTPEPAATATATPVPTVTPTATPEPTEQPQKMYAAKSVDNVQAVSEPEAAKGFTVYFVVPDTINGVTVLASHEIKLNVRTDATPGNSDKGEWWHSHPMEPTGRKTEDGHKIYAVKNCKDIEGKNFLEIQFQLYEGSTWKGEIKLNSNLGPISDYNNKMYDPTKGEWTDDSILTSHTYYAGKPIKFENRSTANLTSVKANFYIPDEKSETLTLVNDGSEAKPVAKEEFVTFTIPDVECSYVQFTWVEDGKNKTSKYYNFYNESVSDDKESFLYSETSNCFIYTGTDNVRWGKENSFRIYYDATFSKMALTGDTGDYSIPKANQSTVYYRLKGDGEESIGGPMSRIEGTDYYAADVPDGYTKIVFSSYPLSDDEDLATCGNSTKWEDIPSGYKDTEQCFYADTNDDAVYGKGQRGGYWAPKDTTPRDAEKGKSTGTKVVDIKPADFTEEADTKYVTSTLYDYYTDYELNGMNRDNYGGWTGVSYRNWVTFREFDQALSDYYKKAKAQYPIYTGHFQPSYPGWGYTFAAISAALNLWGLNSDFNNENRFMAINNSTINENGNNDGEHYDYAYQGLVESKTSTGDATGEPLLKDTLKDTKVVEPHFDEAFLSGTNSKNAKLGDVYNNVAFPFTKKQIFDEDKGVDYWYFDSQDTTLYLKQDTKQDQYFLKSSTDEREKSCNLKSDSSLKTIKKDGKDVNSYGYFPFNETATSLNASTYNYGFGTKLQMDFTLTDDGKVETEKADGTKEKTSIKFFFSGDDDVWVYIDGKLVLDVGGAHGKASGLLEFGKDNTVTPYVSSNKNTDNDNTMAYTTDANNKTVYFNQNPIKFTKTTDKPTQLDKNRTTHTLTMFYMERGMWDSNMAVAFNFPDSNELQVEKEVNVDKVNEEFKGLFTAKDQKLFTFTLQNLATHYGAKPIADNGTPKPVEVGSNFTASSSDTDKTTMKKDEAPSDSDSQAYKDQTVKWYAQGYDKGSQHRNLRYGTMTLTNPLNIKNRDYLSFDVYAVGNPGDGVLSTNYLYLTLVDNNGKKMGCDANSQKSYLNTMLSGSVVMQNDKWVTVKLQLNKMPKDTDFDLTKLSKILIGDDYERTVYFRNFVFTAKPVANKTVGFSVEQADIPDYDSAGSNTLKPASGAIFTSSVAGSGTQAVDTDGTFDLQDGETVTFTDQFSCGSYISLQETENTALYDTRWEVYENGTLVNAAGTSPSVSGTITTPLQGGGTKPEDGRTETADTPSTGSNYNGSKPDANTLVFRSYAAPEEEFPELKVKFINTVKVGTLVIEKKQAPGEEPLTGNYTFTVTFSNVGGIGLGSADSVQPMTITIPIGESREITGIPIGTRFQVVETPAADSSLKSVTCTATDAKFDVDNGVRGTVTSDTTPVTATFTNTAHQLMDIEVEKQWKDAKDKPLTDKLPDIWVKLERRHVNDTTGEWVDATSAVELKYNYMTGKWTHKFERLDKTDVNVTGNPEYVYRVAECATQNDTFTAEGTVTLGTYTYTASQTTDSATGKITLTNTRTDPKFALKLTKKGIDGENTSLLDGVEFKLEKLNDSGAAETTYNGVTGSDSTNQGKCSFTSLSPGEYRLTETKTAEGYTLLAEPIEFTLKADGQCLRDGAAFGAKTTDADGVCNIALTIYNRKGFTLPHTGADAPSLWLLIGLPALVAVLLVLVFRYNKKGGKHS